MHILNVAEAKEAIHTEYPDLKFKVLKQFSSEGAQKRTYNTFLIETSNNRKLVAKSFVVNPQTLELEWKILKQLNEENKDAPKLLYPEIKPKTFMLMEYVDAKDASSLLKESPKELSIFELLGGCVGKFHTTKTNWFGNPIEKEKYYDDWEGLMKDKVDNRVKGLNNILKPHEYTKITDYYGSIRNSFLDDDISQPILIHRDIYIENFLIDKNKNITLIDYGMAYGGRPWYDLGKFYIADLSEYPDAKPNFLKAYNQFVTLPNNFNDLIKYYVFAELTGMLLSHKRYGHEISYNRSHKMLMEVIDEKGIINDLITNKSS